MSSTRPDPKMLALLLALVPFVTIGLGRFAYGLLLPPMRNDLGWSYAAAGTVTTANAAGYLVGALVTPSVLRRRTATQVVLASTWATAAFLIVNGLSGNFGVVLVSRFGAGLTSGVAFVSGSVLAARLVGRGAPRAMMLYPAGAGAGIVFSALTVPPIVTSDSRWPVGWLMLGVAAGAIAFVIGYFWWDEDDSSTLVTTRSAPTATNDAGLLPAEIAYGLFGLGYIAYVTFVVAYLRNSGANNTDIIGFWTLIGLASIAATIFWPRMVRRYDHSLTATLAGCAAGVAMVVISSSRPAAALSAILFGGSFLALVASVTGLARDRLPPERWGAAIARMTVIFGIGQTLGPILTGLLGDTDAGLRIGLTASVVALAIGSIVSIGSIRNPESATA